MAKKGWKSNVRRHATIAKSVQHRRRETINGLNKKLERGLAELKRLTEYHHLLRRRSHSFRAAIVKQLERGGLVDKLTENVEAVKKEMKRVRDLQRAQILFCKAVKTEINILTIAEDASRKHVHSKKHVRNEIIRVRIQRDPIGHMERIRKEILRKKEEGWEDAVRLIDERIAELKESR